MPEIMTSISITAYILFIIAAFLIYKGVKDITQQQEKQTRILFLIAQKHGVSDSELETIDRMNDKNMW